MRSIFIILFVLAGMFSAQTVQAQASRSADDRAEVKKEMEAFYTEIGVSEEQKLAIDEEQRRFGDEMRALRAKGSGRGMVEERDKLAEAHKVNMKEILTEDQFLQWEEKSKEMMERRRSQMRRAKKPNR